MPNYRVTFQPDDRSVFISEQQTLLEAASKAGVYVNQICSGDGLCGRCRVIVREGDVWAESTMHLSREEVQQGYVLACICFPRSDVVIVVPIESRLEGKPRQTDEETQRFSSMRVLVGEKGPYTHEPLSQKLFLDLPKPTLEDSIADKERVFREIKRNNNFPVMQMGLGQLRPNSRNDTS